MNGEEEKLETEREINEVNGHKSKPVIVLIELKQVMITMMIITNLN